jgi:hypothetical protein
MRQLTVVGLLFAVLILPATAQIGPAELQSAPGLPAPTPRTDKTSCWRSLLPQILSCSGIW